MTAWRRWLADPAAPGLVLFAAVALAGLVAIGLGWRVAARTLYVGLQVPAVVSGGLAGLALVFVGAGLATVQVGRRVAAAERVRTERVLDEAAQLLAVLRREDA
jgi:hypothetical protein